MAHLSYNWADFLYISTLKVRLNPCLAAFKPVRFTKFECKGLKPHPNPSPKERELEWGTFKFELSPFFASL